MGNRKIFDHVHEELSLLRGELFPRMELWNSVGEYYNPVTLNKMEAYIFLDNFLATLLPEVPAKKRRQVLKKFRRWDPNATTPEEIFERICGGESRN